MLHSRNGHRWNRSGGNTRYGRTARLTYSPRAGCGDETPVQGRVLVVQKDERDPRRKGRKGRCIWCLNIRPAFATTARMVCMIPPPRAQQRCSPSYEATAKEGQLRMTNGTATLDIDLVRHCLCPFAVAAPRRAPCGRPPSVDFATAGTPKACCECDLTNDPDEVGSAIEASQIDVPFSLLSSALLFFPPIPFHPIHHPL